MVSNRIRTIPLIVALALFFFFLTANRSLRGQEAQGDNFETAVKQKLEQILNNQAKLLEEVQSLKVEITKARVWNR